LSSFKPHSRTNALNRSRRITMSSTAASNSLFEIDAELDTLLDEIQQEIETEGKASVERKNLFQEFCKAHGEKVDRIGRFLRMMEARTLYCRSEADRLLDRARSCDRKSVETKSMVLYYLESRALTKIEGMQFTLRKQRNAVDSVLILDEQQIPMLYKVVEASIGGDLWERLLEVLPNGLKSELQASVKQTFPSNEAIKRSSENVPGTEVKRGSHLRIV
jgi:hypothetical protein